MIESLEVVSITRHESQLLTLLREEPELVENLRMCSASQSHQRSMLERLRLHLIRAVGAQRAAADFARHVAQGKPAARPPKE